MRSGRKKKRSKSSLESAGDSAGAGVVASKQNGKAKRHKDNNEEEEDEMMDSDTENNKEKKEYEMVGIETTTTATVRKVPPETTREAVAAAQVTESTAEEEEEEEAATAATAAAAAAGATNNGAPPNGSNGSGSTFSGVTGGGILRLVSQTLRLPSQQHAPKPPPPTAASSVQHPPESSSPAPPPGGRRLIFETAKKNAASTTTATGAGGGRNKLLMQTRQRQQLASRGGQEEPRSIQREHFPQNEQRGGVATTTATADATADATAVNAAATNMSIKNDVLLYTKSWFLFLLACFVIGNISTIFMKDVGGLTTTNDDAGGLFTMWNVKEHSAKWMDLYGIILEPPNELENVIDGTAKNVVQEEEEEEVTPEIITNVVTLTNPNLLSAAHAKLRAHRMNVYDITKLEMNVKELASGLDMLQGSLDSWKNDYPDLDFGGELLGGKGVGEGEAEGVEKMVENEIVSSDVVIFSKSYCPHCRATKELFQNSKGYIIQMLELDLLPNGQDIQSTLLELTGQTTVPNVFVKGRHVGGNSDVQSLAKSEKLGEMLALPMLENESAMKNEGKKPSYDKIDSMKSGIYTKKNVLLEWESALVGVEEALDLLDQGVIGSKEVNAAMEALSKVSMMPSMSEAMVLDVNKIRLPGEGCEGMDYTPLKQEEHDLEVEDGVEEEEAPNEEEEIVEVVGGIDVDALEIASDAPVRLEDAQIAYDGLLKLAQSTSEVLVGDGSYYSSHVKHWVQQIIQEELQKKELDEPPSVDELHKPIVTNAAAMATSSSSSTNDAGYTARDAVRDIDRLLEKEDADRTGKFDYASVIHGAQVLRRGPYATSYSLYEMLPLLNRFLAYTKLRFYGHPPEVALRPTFPMHARGQCWSFANEFSSPRSPRRPGIADDTIGEYATLSVSLSSAITVSEVVVEHISMNISSNPSTAMKVFRVLGFEDGRAFGEPWELGTYKFEVGQSIQAFSIPTMLDGQNVPKLKAISIAVDSNWGGDYTCLYRVRVHGA